MNNKKKIERIIFFEKLFKSRQLTRIDSGSELLSLANMFNKIENEYLEKNKDNLVNKKIAILGSFTTNYLANILKLYLLSENISSLYYFGNYDNTVQEFLNPKSKLYGFRPDICILFTKSSDIKWFPSLFSEKKDVQEWVNNQIDHYKIFWDKTSEISCQLLQTNFVKPIERQLGNLEANYPFSRWNCIDLLNNVFVEEHPSHVTIIDTEYLASLVGRLKWFSEKDYFVSKQGMSFDVMGLISQSLSNTIAASSGKINKCLVLDLDNTLWGGVIGDDDLHGINLDPNDPLGEAYLSFQSYIKLLKERGVLLAICSKNEEEIAKLPFQKHPNMILKLDDISCFLANWKNKHDNLRKISNTLNIGLDSIVFFDDNPVEREMVSETLPEVKVVSVPEDPAYYVRTLEVEMHFDWVQLSTEDIGRSSSIISNNKRQSLEKVSHNYDDYLKNLKMSAHLDEVNTIAFPRFVQLINKTNQFNMRTKRYTAAELETMRKKDNYKFIYVSLKDKFTDYGLISSLILLKLSNKIFIETWVMSCRVFNRDVEKMIYCKLLEIALDWNCNEIIGEYIPTKINKLIKELYKTLGFKKISSENSPFTSKFNQYSVLIDNAKILNHNILLTNNERLV